MKQPNTCYNALLKTLAYFLAVMGVVMALTCGLGIIALVEMDGYGQSKSEMLQTQAELMAASIADDVANMYAQEHYDNGHGYDWTVFYDSPERTNYRYTITNSSGRVLKSSYAGQDTVYTTTTTVYARYFVSRSQLEDGYVHYYEDEVWVEEPLTVTGYILKDMTRTDQFSTLYRLGGTLHAMRYWLIALLAAGLLMSLCSVIYLLFSAGHRPGREEIILNLLDRVYTDLYLAAVIAATILSCYVFDITISFGYRAYYGESVNNILELALALLGFLATAGALWTVALAFILTTATRLKVGGGYIWRHSLTFRCLCLCGKVVRFLWQWLKLLGRALVRLFRLLPLVWQWLLLGAVLLFVFFLSAVSQDAGVLLAGCVIWLILTAYLAMAIGTLQKHIQAMAKGDLERKIPTRGLHGNFLLMAQDVNTLSTGAEIEVERRMRSERMKTELITNVSHDIKTPLTSIITYVELLQKPHNAEDEQEYLAVLARQSQRLKKLTEDLVEMSKASSGSIAVNLERTNVVELIEQALAEYEEKMERASLQIVKRLPEMELTAIADGRLFWRVMDNLLGNCVKYAMAGTRVYVDVARGGQDVVVSVRNISAAALNISAEELMERFVRGDRSRNTEGSGLGLNIAKSLMELQQGSLHLDVDGDLFKAILTLKLHPDEIHR